MNGYFNIAFGQHGINKSCLADEIDIKTAEESHTKLFY